MAMALRRRPTNLADLDMPQMLVEACCQNHPAAQQPEARFWLALKVDTDQAKAEGRTPFTYVDLTSKAVCPLWLTQDMLGGGKAVEDQALEAASSTITLGSLSAALRGALQKP